MKKGNGKDNMSTIKVQIVNKQRTIKIPSGTRLLIRRCCHAVVETEGITSPCEVSVSFVDNDQIRELNREYRHKDMATDVLSFPLGENGVYDKNPQTGADMLGDIVISMEKAIEQAEAYGHSLEREVGFLTVHAMLHLLGYDHEGGGIERVRMREREETVLVKLGLPRDASYVMYDDER